MSEVVIYDCHFQDIDPQDWPNIPGTVFVTKINMSI